MDMFSDNWAVAFWIVYLIGYAGHLSTCMRDPEDSRLGGWLVLLSLLWPVAALAEVASTHIEEK